MRVVCVYCQQEGRPGEIAEHAPLDDPAVSHGIGAEHLRRLLAEIAALQAGRSAEAPPTFLSGCATPEAGDG
jgi:hypothetical protein